MGGIGHRLGQLEPGPGSQTSIRSAPVAAHDDEPDHVAVHQSGVADRVRDQLGDQQPRVLEPPRREVVGHLAERPPRLGGGVGIAREVDLVPHGAARRLARIVDEVEPLAHARDLEHAHHLLGAGHEREPAAELPRALRRDGDQAQAARVHERDVAQVQHDGPRGVRPPGAQLVLQRGGAGEVELAARARSRPRRRRSRSRARGLPRPMKPKARALWEERTDAPRLRRADCSGPGIRRVRRGRGFGYVDERRRARRRARGAGADRRARDPARLGGRLDLPVPERAPPGDRHRRRRAQAVPLPRRLARAPRRAEVRRHGAVREGAAAAAPACRPRPRRLRDARPRLRARLRRAPARARLLPDRLRGVRGGERVLRAGDDAQASTSRSRTAA